MDIIELLQSSAVNQIMSVDDFDLTLASVDVKGINDLMARMDSDEYERASGLKVEDGVATILVRGLMVPSLSYDLTEYGLTAYNILSKYIDEVKTNPTIRAVDFDIDSAGGFTKGLNKVVDEIKALDKPTRTIATGTMASAAYWLGVASDEVVSINGTNSIGSIGVYASHTNRARQLEANGIEITTFKSGFWKGAFSPNKPLSEREAKRLQAKVDEQAQAFFDHVAENRNGMTAEDVKNLEGDTLSANKALNAGLIDAIRASNEHALTENEGTQANMTTFTQEQMDDALAKAKADAKAEALEAARAEVAEATTRATARTRLVFEHDKGTDAIRALLTSEAFASVSDDNLKALLDAMPDSDVEKALDAQGGAGVEALPESTPAPVATGSEPSDADAKAQADEAAKTMATLDTSKYL